MKTGGKHRDGVNVYFKRKLSLPYDVKRGVERILAAEGRQKCWVNVIFASDGLVKMINTEYRLKNRETDVIAFEVKGGDGGNPGGDVFVSVETARLNAKKYGVTAAEETARLITHGTLHVIGYDHLVAAEERRMAKKTAEYMKFFLVQKQNSGNREPGYGLRKEGKTLANAKLKTKKSKTKRGKKR
jgi:probable rRNA maturation factor